MTLDRATLAPAARAPRGLGVYLASGDIVRGEPARDVPRMREAGLRWAALWVEAPDGRTASVPRLVTWAAALRAHGVTPLLWTFPRPDQGVSAVGRLLEALDATQADGVVLDVEVCPPAVVRAVPERERGALTWTVEGVRATVRAAIDGISERHSLGVTSYPARRGHGLPWDELAAGYGSPQLYQTADDAVATRRSLAAWREAHGEVVPVIDSYRGDHERLRAVAHRMIDAGCRGVGVWAWGTTDGRERRVLAEVAAHYGWA